MVAILLNILVISGLNFSIFFCFGKDILLFYADRGSKVLGAEAVF